MASAVTDLRDNVGNCSVSQACRAVVIGAARSWRTRRPLVRGLPRMSRSMRYSLTDSVEHAVVIGAGLSTCMSWNSSTRVRPATGLLNTTRLVDRVIAGERIGLQRAGKVLQVRLRMNALAIRRITEPHRRRGLAAMRAIIANIGPQARLLGLACSGQPAHHGDPFQNMGHAQPGQRRIDLRWPGIPA